MPDSGTGLRDFYRRSFDRLRQNALMNTLIRLAVIAIVIGGATLIVHAQNQNHHRQVKAEAASNIQTTGPAVVATATDAPAPPAAPKQNTAAAPQSNQKGQVSATTCTKTPIAYQTIYVNDSTLYVGETWTNEVGGIDGYTSHCTAGSSGITVPDMTVQPVNKTIKVGTMPKPAPVQQPAPKTYDEAANYCSGHGVTYNSSGWQQCIEAYLHS